MKYVYMVVTLLLIVIASVALYPKLVPNKASTGTMTNVSTNENNLSCKDYDKYFVVIQDTDEVGTDILIKNKTNNGAYGCEFDQKPEDLKIGGRGSAEYFKDIVARYAITDNGTSASGRKIKFYDIDSKQLVFSDEYQVATLKIESDSLDYFSPTDLKATPENCPEYEEWVGSAAMYAEVAVSIPDLTRKETGAYTCAYRE